VTAVLEERPLAVLTAIGSPSLEAELVAAFGRLDFGVTVVRRCVDVVDLLAAAATQTAAAALVSSDLRGLDRSVLAQLSSCGLAVVGLAGDDAGERWLHQLGASFVLPAGSSPEQVAGALRAAAAEPAPPIPDISGSPSEATRPRTLQSAAGGAPNETVLAVWGPAGAPGRTSVSLGIADALARRHVSTLLVDADPYGGAVATMTGLLDEAPGVIAACRAANAGLLDVPRLADSCRQLGPDLRVLTGLSSARRWPELRPEALEAVLSLARQLANVTVVDCGFSLEDDEDLSYDTIAPRRNAATLTSLQAADRVVCVASADPLGLARLVRELPHLVAVLGDPLGELAESGRIVVVANRLRGGLVPGDPLRAVEEAVRQHAGLPLGAALPMDVAAADAAHGRAELLSEAAPRSELTQAISDLTDALLPAAERSAAAGKAARKRRLRSRPRRSAVDR
jgi:MinD-like ATPase involved in chromosome partitioning or flagellar assembly